MTLPFHFSRSVGTFVFVVSSTKMVQLQMYLSTHNLWYYLELEILLVVFTCMCMNTLVHMSSYNIQVSSAMEFVYVIVKFHTVLLYVSPNVGTETLNTKNKSIHKTQ